MPTTYAAPADVGVAVGDIFYSSWGYDQTNVDFYKVVGLTPKGVRVQEWEAKVVGIDRVAPGDRPRQYHVWEDDPTAPGGRRPGGYRDAGVVTKRLQAGYGGTPGFALTSYSSARKITDPDRTYHATIHSPGH